MTTNLTAMAVYTRSSDGYALDINLFGDCSQLIPLGIRTSETGTIDLQFEGVENFGGVFLFDNLTGQKSRPESHTGLQFREDNFGFVCGWKI